MKASTSRAAVLLLGTAVGLAFWFPGLPVLRDLRGQPAAGKGGPDAPFDFTQPQSPPKPAPAWVKIIDQGERDPRLKGYRLPEGIKVEVVAEEPVVVNPVGMTFADDGTPYVLEWRASPGDEWREAAETFTYKDGSKRQVATMKKRVKDVVKVLRDTAGKGTYDRAEVVLEDELPSSILLHDGWLYLSGRGTVRRFRQSKPGGPFDVKEVIAQGFCGYHHHQVSGLTIGNDGWLYVTSGDDDNHVEGSDGSRATVLRTGAIFRCRPNGSRMQTFARGFRNPYRDVAFDALGNMFHADNDNEDGSKFTGCRFMHVVEGADFGWRLRQGARCCQPDPVRGAVYGELPGKLPPLLKTGRGAPAGLLSYNDTRFPEAYRGLLLYPDVFRKLIRAYRVEQRGATFAVTEEFEFMKSDDPLFRPCQAVLGPDGAIYVVDWRTDSGGAGRLWGDGQHGRIYRLSWAGTKDQPALPLRPMDSWAKIAKKSEGELLEALAGEEGSDRQKAQRELVRRGEGSRPALLKLLADSERPIEARVAALGALESFWNDAVQKAFLAILTRGEGPLRRLAADGLGLNAAAGDREVQAALLKALGDDDPAVRRAVTVAMGRVGAPGAADALVNALAFDDGRDVYLRDGLVRGIERLGKPGIDRLVALAESGSEKETARAVEAFAAMRARPASEALPRLLENPHVSTAGRAALVRSYGNYLLEPPIAPAPLIDYLTAHPGEEVEVKLAGLEVLPVMGGLASVKGAGWVLGLLKDPDARVRLAAVRAVEAGRLTKALPDLIRLLGQADHPAAERLAIVKALRLLTDRSAVRPLQALLADTRDTTADGRALRREAFRTLAVIDPAAAVPAARGFLEGGDAELRTEAVRVLGASAEGARLVGRLFLEKKLPRDSLPAVAEALRKHTADAELARMYAAVLKSGLLISNSPAEVERLRQMVRSRGNPQRGRAVFLNARVSACTRCHRMEGIGGSIGPDLTRLWETLSLDKVIESILEPSKEIKEGYQTFQVTTKKGQAYSGLKVSQTADGVVLRDAEGRDVRIAAGDVDELSPSKVSLMPDNAVAQLTYGEFIDLLAFLKDRSAQESLRGLALDFLVVGLFDGDLKTVYPPEERPGKVDVAAVYPGKGPKQAVKWQPAQAEGTGFLDLKAIFKQEHVSAYALTYVYSPRRQKADMLVGSDDLVRIWLNGEQVHEWTTPRTPAPDQDRVKVTLEAGWNVVLAKVVNLQAGHGLYLRFTGEGLRVSRLPQD